MSEMPKDPQHSELEAKYDAKNVDLTDFDTFIIRDLSDRYKLKDKVTVSGTDIYYERGRDVVRQRIGTGKNPTNELTVKVRKSKGSIQDRHEVDLSFAKKTRPVDVQQFLKLTGWKEAVSLVKTSHIYCFAGADDLWGFDIAIYDVTQTPPGMHEDRRFLEVEIHKDSTLSRERRIEELNRLQMSLQGHLR
jgi:hypothetical protein